MIIHYTRIFIALAALSAAAPTEAISFGGGRSVKVGIGVDMTAAKNNSRYSKNTRLVLFNTLRKLKAGDTLTLIRICDYAATVSNQKLLKKLSKREKSSLLDAAMKPCKNQGSAITKGVKMLAANRNHINIVFTDGGLENDPDAGNFPNAVKRLSAAKFTWFAGLSNQRHKNTSIRDSLMSQLPKKARITLSSITESQNGFSLLTDAFKKARR